MDLVEVLTDFVLLGLPVVHVLVAFFFRNAAIFKFQVFIYFPSYQKAEYVVHLLFLCVSTCSDIRHFRVQSVFNYVTDLCVVFFCVEI